MYKSIDNNVNTVSPIPLPANNDINVDDCKHNESPPQVRSALTTDYLMDIDNSNNTDANGKNDNEITNLLTYEQFSCSISDLSFQEIIIENDALGLCVLFDKSDNIIDIIPKFISCDLFIYDREWADREMFWYLKYTDKNISEYVFKILPIFIDNFHWNIAEKRLTAIYTTEYLFNFPFKILSKALELLYSDSISKDLFKVILTTCTVIFTHIVNHSKDFSKKIKKLYTKYTVDPILRLPDSIPDNVIFLSQIIAGINSGFLPPMLNIHAQQFLEYLEEEQNRRLLKEISMIQNIIKFIFNYDYINSFIKPDYDISDVCYDHFDDIIQHMRITKDTFSTNTFGLSLSDIFNGEHNKYIYFAVHFLLEKNYTSFNGIKRLASYINNLLYKNDLTRSYAITNHKYKEVLFNEDVAKYFIKKFIIKFSKI